MFDLFKRQRRERLRSAPFPSAWLEIIEQNVPYYAHLPEAGRNELQGLVQIFLAEKNFEGCGGLELTDEIKVTVAAHACVLLLHRDTDIFPRLASILIYPSAYVAKAVEPLAGQAVLEGEQVRLGEAWKDGVAIVSWDDVRETALGRNFGKNLILHEFAHLLDMEDGAADGTPKLRHLSQYESWAKVMQDEYERLRSRANLDRYTVLDTYGATNAAEFFAVATEAFFEKPTVLRKRHPELYEELKSFYQQDPATLLPIGVPPAPSSAEPRSREGGRRMEREYAIAMTPGLLDVVPPAVFHALASSNSSTRRTTRAGTPTTSEPGATSMFSSSKAPAPMIEPRPTRTPLSKIAPMPIRQSSSTVQPCRMTRCPTVTRSPTEQGIPGSAWIIVRSWMLDCAPMEIRSVSPRSTELYQTLDSAPMWTSPRMIAPGAMNAVGSIMKYFFRS